MSIEIENTNSLAKKFAAIMGNTNIIEDYKMWESELEEELLCWRLACTAQEELVYIDVESHLEGMEV